MSRNTVLCEKGISEKDISKKGISEEGISEKGISEKGISEKGISVKGISEKGTREMSIVKKLVKSTILIRAFCQDFQGWHVCTGLHRIRAGVHRTLIDDIFPSERAL